MRATLRWLGTIFGTLSVVMLVKQGFDYGFVAPLQLILDYYERITQLLLGWLEPSIKEYLATLNSWLGLDLLLGPHWRHVFVLMWLYFVANARTNWNRTRHYFGANANWKRTHYYFAIFTLIWGGIVALTTSLAAGAVSLRNPTDNLMLVAFPIAGLMAFELGRGIWRGVFRAPSADYFGGSRAETRWENFSHHLYAYVLPIAMSGGATFLLGWWAQDSLGALRSPGLATLAIFVVATMLAWLARGSVLASTDRQPDETWAERFLASGSTQFSFLVLSIIIGAVVYIALNVGLELMM